MCAQIMTACICALPNDRSSVTFSVMEKDRASVKVDWPLNFAKPTSSLGYGYGATSWTTVEKPVGIECKWF